MFYVMDIFEQRKTMQKMRFFYIVSLFILTKLLIFQSTGFPDPMSISYYFAKCNLKYSLEIYVTQILFCLFIGKICSIVEI